MHTVPLRKVTIVAEALLEDRIVRDVRGQRLVHDQRIARAGFGVAQASEADTRIRLQDWTLERRDTARGKPDFAASRYTTHIVGSEFGLDLVFDSTQPVLLQGQQGLSRKGPDAEQASYYYSQPQLTVSGTLQVGNKRMAVTPDTGRAWLDHEWSEALLHPEADFYVVGAKSFGRLSGFSLPYGYGQIREVFAYVSERPDLDLYERAAKEEEGPGWKADPPGWTGRGARTASLSRRTRAGPGTNPIGRAGDSKRGRVATGPQAFSRREPVSGFYR